MSASLAWIDFSSAERARSQRILSALREPDSVDELGLGTIRDALSDALFPGTSTIQTRLAYFLMVPWIFRRLERERLDETRVADRARDRELALIPALKENRDHDGTIGLRSESRIKRLPSMVYWGGLRTWEIFRASLSREQYLAELPDLRRRRRRLEAERPDDQGVDPEHLETWHDHLPEAPDDFPTAASFALRPIDAEFLLGRIQSAPRCRGSMLAWLAGRGDGAEGETPWLHPRLAEMPAAIRDLVELARAFSDLTQGARLLYNVLLWEGRPDGDRDERLEELHATFADWESGWHGAVELDPTRLWDFLAGQGARVPRPTRDFVECWLDLARRQRPGRLVGTPAARDLVRQRELNLKGAKSRFANELALDAWSGSSGRRPFSYRWLNVRRHLADLAAGRS